LTPDTGGLVIQPYLSQNTITRSAIAPDHRYKRPQGHPERRTHAPYKLRSRTTCGSFFHCRCTCCCPFFFTTQNSCHSERSEEPAFALAVACSPQTNKRSVILSAVEGPAGALAVPRSSSPTQTLVILSAAKEPAFAIAVAVAFAVEIGPGFRPDIPNHHKLGFSPWDMPSYPPKLSKK
jgi:hypothetical protein